ncbi:MAG: glycosyltransferase, partial [Patescibacteria group bacterium]
MAQLTIQIVGFNGEEHLQRAVAALRNIPPAEADVRYIDNASTDSSVEVVRSALPRADIITRAVNTGYAGGHNIGFALCRTPFVLVHDQDVVIEWPGIKQLLEAFRDERVAAVQGKLYRSESKVFDTAGIVQTLSLNGVDRGAIEEDRGQFDNEDEVFAAQGACALYRMDALREVAQTKEWTETEIPDVFDEDFFAYKEEVDLGWRLRNEGWRAAYRPIVAGYHARTLGKRGFLGWGFTPSVIRARVRSPRTRYSLRNYCW